MTKPKAESKAIPKAKPAPTLRDFRDTANASNRTTFHVEMIPASIRILHDRVLDGHADATFGGQSFRVCAVVPTEQDQTRFPSLLKSAACIWLAYGVRHKS